MLFTDIAFLFFLPTVFCIYWLVLRHSTRWQNVLLLAASYVFYGWWDWRFLFLIILTSAATFGTALLARGPRAKMVTTANIILNIGILMVFKYLGFFADNLKLLASVFGISLDWFTVDVLLPVGISFYTFQAISYSVDVYKHRIEPCRDIVTFFTYIAYFPQLVAGPIERPAQLLPQIAAPRRWDYGYAVTGLRMVLYGLMKKLCLADMAGMYTDYLFDVGIDSAGRMMLAGVVFSFQLYCDFSAYSDIARGVSRLLGIELMANFRFPFFSRGIGEFWRRWHISLMTWMRDYVYIPLGGSRLGNSRTAVNIMIVFLLSGLWHGAGWNFVLWGLYCGLTMIVWRFVIRAKEKTSDIEWNDLPRIIAIFGVTAFGLYIFRCTNMDEVMAGLRYLPYMAVAVAVAVAAAMVIRRLPLQLCVTFPILGVAAYLCSGQLGLTHMAHWYTWIKLWWTIPAAIALTAEWTNRNNDWAMAVVPRRRIARTSLYWVMLLMVILSEPMDITFIYFQF